LDLLLQVGQAKAEAMCNDIGGHLAAYVSQEEQTEMEYAFLNSGYLLPSFHKTYWIGLMASADSWPSFSWLDRNVPSPQESGAYRHWGTYRFDGYRSVAVQHCSAPCARHVCPGNGIGGRGRLALECPFCKTPTLKTTIRPPRSSPEPNNVDFPENCAVANFTESYGTPLAWGWADASCTNVRAAVICRRLRE
jgi:hypothetical protein